MPRSEPLLEFELFRTCSPAQVSRIRSLLTLLPVDAGTVLLAEGGYGFEFILVAGGRARVSVRSDDGDVTLAELGAGDFAGEMSLLGRVAHSATVTAETPMTVYVANAAEFAGIVSIAPGVAAAIEETADRRRRSNEHLAAAA